jgi:uncharacterized protein (TIGR02588 family)
MAMLSSSVTVSISDLVTSSHLQMLMFVWLRQRVQDTWFAANTQAVVDLAAGEYNIEFMSWERGGGAFYELTAAKGDFVTSGAQFAESAFG